VQIPLLAGAYTARNLIANAQRSLNLFPEANPPNSNPQPMTHYPTPGLTILARPPTAAAGRGLYTDITGTLFGVVGTTVYKIDQSWTFTSIGTLVTQDINTPVSMTDNETNCVLVDGSTNGYYWDVGTGDNFTQIGDANFFGSTHVDYLNTFTLFNKPDTPIFYTTLSGTLDFNSLYFAGMTGTSTDLVAVWCLHGYVWLIGKTGCEIWFNQVDTTNPNLLPFQRMPDQVIHQGCVAPYSIARILGNDDTQTCLVWLSQTKDGNVNVVLSQGFQVKDISTHAIDYEISKYPVVNDAVAWAYQQEGHTFYVLNFPTANKTWVFDLTVGLWHERAWTDYNTGNLNRHRGQAHALAYGTHVVQDWEDGTIYRLDLDTYVDQHYDTASSSIIDGPISRIRSMPHLVNGLNRVIYARFQADMDSGDSDPNDDASAAIDPIVSLRWSDTRGHSWSNPVMQHIGTTGEYNTSILWTRLGMARDRVFELSWSSPVKTALQGAYVEPIPLAT